MEGRGYRVVGSGTDLANIGVNYSSRRDIFYALPDSGKLGAWGLEQGEKCIL